MTCITITSPIAMPNPASMPPQNARSLLSCGSGCLAASELGAGCAPDAAADSWPPSAGCCSFIAQSCHPDAAHSELVADPGTERSSDADRGHLSQTPRTSAAGPSMTLSRVLSRDRNGTGAPGERAAAGHRLGGGRVSL